MKKNYKENFYKHIDNFYLGAIVFLKENQCYLYGHLPEESIDIMLMCRQETLNDIFGKMGEESDELLDFISQKISKNITAEQVITVEEATQMEFLVIDNFIIIAKPIEPEPDSKFTPFFIEDVIQKQDFDKEKEGPFKAELYIHLNDLKKNYKEYLQLVDENVSVVKAKKITGLDNELLFRMAYLTQGLSGILGSELEY